MVLGTVVTVNGDGRTSSERYHRVCHSGVNG